MLSLASIGIHSVISELYCKGKNLHMNDRKMTIVWSFSNHFYVKLWVKIIWECKHDADI